MTERLSVTERAALERAFIDGWHQRTDELARRLDEYIDTNVPMAERERFRRLVDWLFIDDQEERAG